MFGQTTSSLSLYSVPLSLALSLTLVLVHFSFFHSVCLFCCCFIFYLFLNDLLFSAVVEEFQLWDQ